MTNNMSLKKIQLLFLTSILIILPACAPKIYPASSSVLSCQITKNLFTTADSTELSLKVWQPEPQEIKAIIIAIHGFNDYSQFFQQPGRYFSEHNIISYAYDQRGFGESASWGLWAGVDTYLDDLGCFIQLIKSKHQNIPVYLLGESMGGAIAISTITQSSQSLVDGMILAAPAIWARETMPWYQNAALWTLSHTLPWLTLTGESLEITPSDNIDMLRALGGDPLIIKETRIESIYGLVNLMDQALSSTNQISTNTLLLYGEKDEIIPKEPTYQFLQKLKTNRKIPHTIAFYKNGYHMLLRDLQASIIWDDVIFWINSHHKPLPSGADKRAEKLLAIEAL